MWEAAMGASIMRVDQTPGVRLDWIEPFGRCAHLSPVRDHMTPASALVTVPPLLSCREADERARAAAVRHLVVGTVDAPVGVVCRCDWARARPDTPVGALVHSPLFALSLRNNLGQAAASLAQLGIGCLPVVDAAGRLLGMVTRGDLRRAGVPERLLGAHRCCECGTVHSVTRGPHGLDLCIDCIDVEDELDEDYDSWRAR
jgi:hypothetical protein